MRNSDRTQNDGAVLGKARICRLALGTAQFGLPYGVANRSGQVTVQAGERILSVAWAAGMNTIDTAIAYGESEARLGELGVAQWRVFTKLPGLQSGARDVRDWVERSVVDSLRKLRLNRLAGIHFHHPTELTGPDGALLYAGAQRCKAAGLVEKLGVSIYDPAELHDLTAMAHFDVVQAPYNVLDRRLETSGWLARLETQGVEIHSRSAFLQGLLLMQPHSRPVYFARWAQLWETWDDWLSVSGSSAAEICLGFVLSRTEIDRVVIGVDSVEQLEQLLAAAAGDGPPPPNSFASSDPDLVNPSRWRI
jgi:aryl-alcohol dehydrogenase-like predicted oxidoreductase